MTVAVSIGTLSAPIVQLDHSFQDDEQSHDAHLHLSIASTFARMSGASHVKSLWKIHPSQPVMKWNGYEMGAQLSSLREAS